MRYLYIYLNPDRRGIMPCNATQLKQYLQSSSSPIMEKWPLVSDAGPFFPMDQDHVGNTFMVLDLHSGDSSEPMTEDEIAQLLKPRDAVCSCKRPAIGPDSVDVHCYFHGVL